MSLIGSYPVNPKLVDSLNEFLSSDDCVSYEFLCENVHGFDDALTELNTRVGLDHEEGLCAWCPMFDKDGRVSVTVHERKWVTCDKTTFVFDGTKFV